ncbi:MAG: hypothetical protein AAGJ87_04840, partial [Pseudomonadota bacterium]
AYAEIAENSLLKTSRIPAQDLIERMRKWLAHTLFALDKLCLTPMRYTLLHFGEHPHHQLFQSQACAGLVATTDAEANITADTAKRSTFFMNRPFLPYNSTYDNTENMILYINCYRGA